VLLIYRKRLNMLLLHPYLKAFLFSSPSPGTRSVFFDDDIFNDHTTYIKALGEAMKTEYESIYAAGLMLQVDCPDLGMGRHSKFKNKTIGEFQSIAEIHIEVMNSALANIPADRLRMHVCWGNYPGPHHHDVPLADIVHLVLTAKPKYLSIESCNPGHGHDWEVFKTLKFQEGKVLMPEVLDTTTSHIQHPRLVAQRWRRASWPVLNVALLQLLEL
jgi:5-methyltetrahydropteroyltriglutamate--homocysteine methyltransferase